MFWVDFFHFSVQKKISSFEDLGFFPRKNWYLGSGIPSLDGGIKRVIDVARREGNWRICWRLEVSNVNDEDGSAKLLTFAFIFKSCIFIWLIFQVQRKKKQLAVYSLFFLVCKPGKPACTVWQELRFFGAPAAITGTTATSLKSTTGIAQRVAMANVTSDESRTWDGRCNFLPNINSHCFPRDGWSSTLCL